MNWPKAYIGKQAYCRSDKSQGLTLHKSYTIYDIAPIGEFGLYEVHVNNDLDSKQWYPADLFVPANCNCTCVQCMSSINTPAFKIDAQHFDKHDEGFSEPITELCDMAEKILASTGDKFNCKNCNDTGWVQGITGKILVDGTCPLCEVGRSIKSSENCGCPKTGPGYCKCKPEGQAFPGAPEPDISDYMGAMTGVEMRPALSTSELRIDGLSNTRAPHSCPVCFGRGQVPSGFYNSVGQYAYMSINGSMPERCKSCSGSGVVWG